MRFIYHKRVRVTRFVPVRSLVGDKTHMGVEADGLRVLLIDGDFPDSAAANPVCQQPSAQPGSPFLRQEKEHFQALPVYPHKADWMAAFPFGYDQTGNVAQCLGDVCTDFPDLGI